MNPFVQDTGIWIATDLDGTLFSREHAGPDAVPATWRISGDPSSWMRADLHALMQTLSARFPIVAVTARDMDSFARVRIEGVPFHGAVIANGAIIMAPGGSIDLSWAVEMARALSENRHLLLEIRDTLVRITGDHAKVRLVAAAEDVAAYVVAKSNQDCWLGNLGREAIARIRELGARCNLLGRELQCLPPGLSKEAGLRAFSVRYARSTTPILAFGDASSDLGFLSMARFMALPSDSELATTLTSRI